MIKIKNLKRDSNKAPTFTANLEDLVYLKAMPKIDKPMTLYKDNNFKAGIVTSLVQSVQYEVSPHPYVTSFIIETLNSIYTMNIDQELNLQDLY